MKKYISKIFLIFLALLIILSVGYYINYKSKKEKIQKIKSNNNLIILKLQASKNCYASCLEYLQDKISKTSSINTIKSLPFDKEYLEKKLYCESLYGNLVADLVNLKGWNKESNNLIEKIVNVCKESTEEYRNSLSKIDEQLSKIGEKEDFSTQEKALKSLLNSKQKEQECLWLLVKLNELK